MYIVIYKNVDKLLIDYLLDDFNGLFNASSGINIKLRYKSIFIILQFRAFSLSIFLGDSDLLYKAILQTYFEKLLKRNR